MGGIHTVVEVAARDVARIIQFHKVLPQVQTEVNHRLQELLRISILNLEVQRAAPQVPSGEVAGAIMTEIVARVIETEIPKRQVAEAERRASALQQQIQSLGEVIQQKEKDMEELDLRLRHSEEARAFLMASYFKEVATLRQQLAYVSGQVNRGSPMSPYSTSRSGFVKGSQSFAGGTRGSLTQLTPTQLMRTQQAMIDADDGGDDGAEDVQTPSFCKAPRPSTLPSDEVSMQHSLAMQRGSVHSPSGQQLQANGEIDAIFDYERYVSITNESIMAWPEKYKALQRRHYDTIQQIQIAASSAAIQASKQIRDLQKEIHQRDVKIFELQSFVNNFRPIIMDCVDRVRVKLWEDNRIIRREVVNLQRDQTNVIGTLSEHVMEIEKRLDLFVRFVKYCSVRLLRKLRVIQEGNRVSATQGKPLWQYFLLEGPDDMFRSAKSYWQEQEIVKDIIDQFKQMMIAAERISQNAFGPPSDEELAEGVDEDGNPIPSPPAPSGDPQKGEGRKSTGGVETKGRKSAAATPMSTKAPPPTPPSKKAPPSASSSKGDVQASNPTGRRGSTFSVASSQPSQQGGKGSGPNNGSNTSGAQGSQVLNTPVVKKTEEFISSMLRRIVDAKLRRVMCRIRRKVFLQRLPVFIRNIVMQVTQMDEDLRRADAGVDRYEKKRGQTESKLKKDILRESVQGGTLFATLFHSGKRLSQGDELKRGDSIVLEASARLGIARLPPPPPAPLRPEALSPSAIPTMIAAATSTTDFPLGSSSFVASQGRRSLTSGSSQQAPPPGLTLFSNIQPAMSQSLSFQRQPSEPFDSHYSSQHGAPSDLGAAMPPPQTTAVTHQSAFLPADTQIQSSTTTTTTITPTAVEVGVAHNPPFSVVPHEAPMFAFASDIPQAARRTSTVSVVTPVGAAAITPPTSARNSAPSTGEAASLPQPVVVAAPQSPRGAVSSALNNFHFGGAPVTPLSPPRASPLPENGPTSQSNTPVAPSVASNSHPSLPVLDKAPATPQSTRKTQPNVMLIAHDEVPLPAEASLRGQMPKHLEKKSREPVTVEPRDHSNATPLPLLVAPKSPQPPLRLLASQPPHLNAQLYAAAEPPHPCGVDTDDLDCNVFRIQSLERDRQQYTSANNSRLQFSVPTLPLASSRPLSVRSREVYTHEQQVRASPYPGMLMGGQGTPLHFGSPSPLDRSSAPSRGLSTTPRGRYK